MNRLRAIAILLSCAMFATACGEVAPESLAFAMSDTEETVLRIATPRIAGFEGVIANWEREHPTVEVDVVVRNIDDHHESLLNESETGNGSGNADIVAFDASYGPEVRAREDILVDLSQFDATPPSSRFLDARWAEGVADSGAIVGVPLDVESTALLVRTDLVGDRVMNQLRNASSWCDVLSAGDAFSDETNSAFLADGDDLLSAILAQTRTSFVDDTGSLRASEVSELERAFDLVMLAIGENPAHDNPCPGAVDIERIARNLTFGSPQWRAGLQDDDFAAAIAPWSARRRIANASPQTAGLWETIAIPVDSGAATSGSSSDGGLHLGIAAGSTQFELAYDLLLTLTDTAIQEVAFARGLGPLPAAAQLHTSSGVDGSADDFFTNDTTALIYSEAALNRPSATATPERRVVINAMLSAVNRVEGGGQTSREAWESMVDQVSKALS